MGEGVGEIELLMLSLHALSQVSVMSPDSELRVCYWTWNGHIVDYFRINVRVMGEVSFGLTVLGNSCPENRSHFIHLSVYCTPLVLLSARSDSRLSEPLSATVCGSIITLLKGSIAWRAWKPGQWSKEKGTYNMSKGNPFSIIDYIIATRCKLRF